MSNLPGWLGRLGAELTDLGERLERRRAEAEEGEAEPIEPPVPAPVPATAAAVPDEAARPEAAAW